MKNAARNVALMAAGMAWAQIGTSAEPAALPSETEATCRFSYFAADEGYISVGTRDDLRKQVTLTKRDIQDSEENTYYYGEVKTQLNDSYSVEARVVFESNGSALISGQPVLTVNADLFKAVADGKEIVIDSSIESSDSIRRLRYADGNPLDGQSIIINEENSSAILEAFFPLRNRELTGVSTFGSFDNPEIRNARILNPELSGGDLVEKGIIASDVILTANVSCSADFLKLQK